MRLYPAIDLRGGRVVRLVQGDPGRETRFGDDPLAMAERFAGDGFRSAHVVNLDAAFGEDDAANVRAIGDIAGFCDGAGLEMQLGGGIRDGEAAARWLGLGVTFLVVSTLAVRSPGEFARVCGLHSGAVRVSVDLRGERLSDGGWLEDSEMSWRDLVKRSEDAGAAGFIRTEILRDGTVAGMDVDRIGEFARATDLPVIAAGGLASVADLEALRADGKIYGAVLGRALYDGAIDPAAAVAFERTS